MCHCCFICNLASWCIVDLDLYRQSSFPESFDHCSYKNLHGWKMTINYGTNNVIIMKGIFLLAGVLDCQCDYCCGYACIAIQWPLQTQQCSCVSQVYATARIPHTRNRWDHFIDRLFPFPFPIHSHCTNICPAVPISTTIPVNDRRLTLKHIFELCTSQCDQNKN